MNMKIATLSVSVTGCTALPLIIYVQFAALRRVHLIPEEDTEEDPDAINANVFRNLDSAVSEGGENFSTGYANSFPPDIIFVSHQTARSNCCVWPEPSSNDQKFWSWTRLPLGEEGP